jgi:cell division protein FtsW
MNGLLPSGPRRKRDAPPPEYSVMLTATLCLVAFGALMVFSATSVKAVLPEGGGDSAEYLKRVVVFAVLGLIVMRIFSTYGLRIARATTPAFLVLAILMLLAVLVPGVGQTVNGSQRWLGAGVVQFQPSEIAKVAVLLYGAHLLASEPRGVRTLQGLGPFLIVCGVFLGLIALQPDLGTASTIIFSSACLLLLAGTRPRTLAPVAAVLAVGVVALIASHPYQQARLTSFLDPAADLSGAGYQSAQAEIAIGSGGPLGVGLGESIQKASYLPEAHTDMIAAVIGEESGFAGMLVLIALFGMFGWAGFKAAHRATDRYSKLLAASLTSLVLIQAGINLFAVMGLAPLTGIPLPFVSYGGTSLVVMLAAVGLLLNVARGPVALRASTPSRSEESMAGPRVPRRRPRAGGAAKLQVIEGGKSRPRTPRKRPAPGRDRSRRHGGTRRSRGGGSGRASG